MIFVFFALNSRFVWLDFAPFFEEKKQRSSDLTHSHIFMFDARNLFAEEMMVLQRLFSSFRLPSPGKKGTGSLSPFSEQQQLPFVFAS